MKLFPMIVALAVVTSVTACEYKEQRTVQQPALAPAAVVAHRRPRVLSSTRRRHRQRRPFIADFVPKRSEGKSLASP
jgi:hypothetical protein